MLQTSSSMETYSQEDSEPSPFSEVSRKRPTTQEVSVTVNKPATEPEDIEFTTHATLLDQTHSIESYGKISYVAEYSDVKTQLCEILTSYNPQSLINLCESLVGSDAHCTPLFCNAFIETLRRIKNTSVLMQAIISFTNWIDHSILSAVVSACNVPEAVALLKQFDDSIDTSQSVTKYPIPSPSYHMVPYGTSIYTVLAVQLNLELYHSTLQNVLDARLLIQEKCEVTPHCLQLLAVAKTSHTIIYWTIPKHVASLIISNVQKYQNYLFQNGIQQVAVYPGTILATSSGSLTVGPFSFFAKVSVLAVLKMC